jgi:hypothetical protein
MFVEGEWEFVPRKSSALGSSLVGTSSSVGAGEVFGTTCASEGVELNPHLQEGYRRGEAAQTVSNEPPRRDSKRRATCFHLALQSSGEPGQMPLFEQTLAARQDDLGDGPRARSL